MNTIHWDYLLILVFLGAVVPIAGKLRVDRILSQPDTSRWDRLRIYGSTVVFQWALVGITLWRLEIHGTNIKELGLETEQSGAVLLVSLVLVGMVSANQILSLRLLRSRPEELRGKVAQVALRIFPRDRVERLVFLAVVSSVAFCEEFLFRGFVQFLLTAISGLTLIGIIGSAVLFSAAHLYQGRRGLIATFIVGLLFAFARSVSRSLIPCVIAHFIIDFIAGYCLRGRIQQALANTESPSLTQAGVVEHL
jgi:membrane protease YdiL (CAAX protease family)